MTSISVGTAEYAFDVDSLKGNFYHAPPDLFAIYRSTKVRVDYNEARHSVDVAAGCLHRRICRNID